MFEYRALGNLGSPFYFRGCPQCRVKSSYFIPHKYWIGDSDEKLKLIEDFKAKTGYVKFVMDLKANNFNTPAKDNQRGCFCFKKNAIQNIMD